MTTDNATHLKALQCSNINVSVGARFWTQFFGERPVCAAPDTVDAGVSVVLCVPSPPLWNAEAWRKPVFMHTRRQLPRGGPEGNPDWPGTSAGAAAAWRALGCESGGRREGAPASQPAGSPAETRGRRSRSEEKGRFLLAASQKARGMGSRRPSLLSGLQQNCCGFVFRATAATAAAPQIPHAWLCAVSRVPFAKATGVRSWSWRLGALRSSPPPVSHYCWAVFRAADGVYGV